MEIKDVIDYIENEIFIHDNEDNSEYEKGFVDGLKTIKKGLGDGN